MKAGAYSLLQYVREDHQEWVTCTNWYAVRCRNMLMDLISTPSSKNHLLFSPTPMKMYYITGERDLVPTSNVMVTSWLCLRVFVRTKITRPQARAITRRAGNEVVRKSNKTVTVAAGCLIDAFRKLTVDRDRQNASEITFCWRYIPEGDSQDLMWRLSVLETLRRANGSPKMPVSFSFTQ